MNGFIETSEISKGTRRHLSLHKARGEIVIIFASCYTSCHRDTWLTKLHENLNGLEMCWIDPNYVTLCEHWCDKKQGSGLNINWKYCGRHMYFILVSSQQTESQKCETRFALPFWELPRPQRIKAVTAALWQSEIDVSADGWPGVTCSADDWPGVTCSAGDRPCVR